MESLFEISFKNSLPLLNPKMNFAEKSLGYAKLYIKAFPENEKLINLAKLLEHLLNKKMSYGDIIIKYTEITGNERKLLLTSINEKSKELYEKYPEEDNKILKELSTFSVLLDFIYTDLNKVLQNLPKPNTPNTTPTSAKTLLNSPIEFFTLKRK